MNVPGPAEEFARLIATEAAATLQTFLAEIINETTNYRTVRSLTQQVEHQYHGRFLIELLQNAHDALGESTGRVSFSLLPDEGDFGCLYVANDGHPFERNNFQSLARLGQSSKDPNDSIGNKGIGFRSVLEICAAPELYSRARQTSDGFDGYCFRFNPEIVAGLASAIARLADPTCEARLELGDSVIPLRWTADDRRLFRERLTAKPEGWLGEELTFLSAYSIPLPVNRVTFAEKIGIFESQGYASVVRLPLKSGKAQDLVIQRLKTFSPANLLFLERLDELSIELGPERRVLERRSQSLGTPFDGQRVTISSSEGELSYRVWSVDIGGEENREDAQRLRQAVRELPGKWPELSRARVSIAARVGPTPEPGVISIFLPSQIKTGTATHINGPFFADMSRTDVNFDEPLNRLLLDSAVSMAAGLILGHLQGRAVEEARIVVDLLGASGDRSGNGIDLPGRIADIIKTKQGRIDSLPVLLTDRGWCKPEAVRLLPNVNSFAFFTEPRFRELAPFPVASGGLAGRVEGVGALLERFGGAQRGSVLDSEVAAVVEAGAKKVQADAEQADWAGFWRDVMALLPRGLSPLQGRSVLLGLDGALHAGSEQAPVFFPPGRGDDEDENDSSEATTGVLEVPPTLQGKLAFLSERVPTHGVGEQGRRRRLPLYSALNAVRLVTTFRAENIVRGAILAAIPKLPVALDSDEDRQLRELLRWALTLYSRRRLEAVAKLLSALPLPCAGGWFPAGESSFGPGWEGTTGDDLAVFLRGLDSTGCRHAGRRLLLPPSDERWQGVPASTETLVALGVFDGVRLGANEPDAWPSSLSVVWHEGEKFLSLPEEPPPGYTKAFWSQYRKACSQRYRPAYQSGYRFDSLVTLPGLDLLASMPRENRLAFTTVLLHSIPKWLAQWRVARVHRPAGTADTREINSPVAFALRNIDWLTFQSEGEFTAARPSGRWLVPSQILAGQAHHFRHLFPFPLDLARRIEAIPGAREALNKLAMPVYEPDQLTTDSRLLDDLASAWSERRELVRNRDVFVGQVRAAWGRFRPIASTVKPTRLVITRGDRNIDVVAPEVANPVYLPDAGELVNSALSLMSVPVLLIDSREAKDLSTQLKAWYGQAIVNASDLEVRPLASGALLADELENADLLDEDEQLGWLPVVALTLAAFQSDRSHGTGTRGFREGMSRLRNVRIKRVPKLELGIMRAGQTTHALPVSSFWVQSKNTLLIDQDAERRSLAALSGTLRAVLDRADRELELALKLVLDRLATIRPPTESQIVEALDTVNITERQFGEVMQHWAGEQQWLVERLRPLVLLLVGNEGLRRFDEQTSDASRQVVLERVLQTVGLAMPEPTWLLELVRGGKTMLDIGHELHSKIGPDAELGRWNRALTELHLKPIVNPESTDQFEAHL